MKNEEIKTILNGIPLFSVLGEGETESLIGSSEITEFKAGAEIIPKSCEKAVKVLLDGTVSVTKRNGEKELLMRVVEGGGILGVASVFTEKTASLSHIKAVRDCTVLFISHEKMQSLVDKSSGFASAYIRLLTSKIQFLNQRVKAYTSKSAESRLAFHILSLDETKHGRVEVGVSKTALADMLDIGRASLYRALDTLTEKKIIEYKKSEIIVLDRESLKRVAENG